MPVKLGTTSRLMPASGNKCLRWDKNKVGGS